MPKRQDNRIRMTHELSIKGLEFSYPPQEELVLNIPAWRLEKGSQLFLHGPSGCGKSTLLNILSGILPTATGQVNLFGTQLDQLTAAQRDAFRANHIGYVFQRFNLVPYLTAIDNVRLACYFAGDKTNHQAKEAEIGSLMQKLGVPQSHWHNPSNQLSVGQQQRVAIARALINQPELLIVDEPTSSLDKQNCNAFMHLMMQQVVSRDTTLIFVSHDASLASFFNQVQAISDFNTVTDENPIF